MNSFPKRSACADRMWTLVSADKQNDKSMKIENRSMSIEKALRQFSVNQNAAEGRREAPGFGKERQGWIWH